jgi:hypothetical protein
LREKVSFKQGCLQQRFEIFIGLEHKSKEQRLRKKGSFKQECLQHIGLKLSLVKSTLRAKITRETLELFCYIRATRVSIVKREREFVFQPKMFAASV